jgi:hypothetical protein
VAASTGDLLTPTLTDHRPRDPAGPRPWRLTSLVYPSIIGGPATAAVVAVVNARRLRVPGRTLVVLAAAGVLATAIATALAVLVEHEEARILIAVCGVAVYGLAHRLERSADRIHATFSPHTDPAADYAPFLAPALASILLGWAVLTVLVFAFGGPA